MTRSGHFNDTAPMPDPPILVCQITDEPLQHCSFQALRVCRRRPQEGVLRHVEKVQRGAEGARQLASLFQRRFRSRTEIRGHEDLCKGDHTENAGTARARQASDGGHEAHEEFGHEAHEVHEGFWVLLRVLRGWVFVILVALRQLSKRTCPSPRIIPWPRGNSRVPRRGGHAERAGKREKAGTPGCGVWWHTTC